MNRLPAILLAAAALSACATGTVPNSPPPRPAPGVTVGNGTAEVATPPPGSAATTALLEQSRSERDAGDLGRAAATIERALAIAPEDAELWVVLAEIRAEQGDRVLAAEMARKALTLTAEGTEIARRARRLISR